MNATLAQGSEFAGHRIEGELGRGGMGVVYRAVHISLDQRRALKVMDPRLLAEPDALERFRREARLAASVDHPAVVRVYDAGEVGGTPFISMQLIEGVDLGKLLDDGPLATGRALSILSQIASGLDAAHAAGLVHRDVKPANVMLAAAGERAYLGDFGIGLLLDPGHGERLTAESRVLGTASYVSPEQIDGRELDGRADIYSLGCLAFEMLTGTVPFEADTQLATLSAHGSAPRPSAHARNPALPGDVDPVLARAIAIDREERPASAVGLVRELEAALGGRAADAAERRTAPLIAPPAPAREPASRSTAGRRPLLLAAAVLLAAAAAVVGALLAAGDSEQVERTDAVLTIDVPREPVSVAAGAEFVWVASRAGGRVGGFDAQTGEPAGISYGIEAPRALALGPGHLWAVTSDHLYDLGIDGGSQRVSPVAFEDAADVAVDKDAVWVLDRGNGSGARVVRVDLETLEQTGEAFVGADPQGVAAGAGAVWVANTGEGTVSEIDPAEAEVVGSPIEVGGRPEGIAAAGGQVWTVDNFGGRLVPIDPSGEQPSVGGAIETLPRPRGLALGFGSVWVSSGEEGTVQRFAADGDHELEQESAVGGDPADLSVGSGRVFSADSDDDTVSAIDP